MRSLLVHSLLVLVAVSFGAACGDSGPTGPEARVRIVLEADISRLPADADVQEAMEGAKTIIERRVNEFGVEATVEIDGTNRLLVQLSGIERAEALDLIGHTAQLTFAEPRQDDAGNIICRIDGLKLAVPPGSVAHNDGLRAVACIDPSGEGGAIVAQDDWLSATCQGQACGDLQGTALTGRFLRANAEVVDSATGPVIAIEFNQDGATPVG